LPTAPAQSSSRTSSRELGGPADPYRNAFALREYVRDEAVATVVDSESAVRLWEYEQRRKLRLRIVEEATVHVSNLRGIAGLRMTVADRHFPDVRVDDRRIHEAWLDGRVVHDSITISR